MTSPRDERSYIGIDGGGTKTTAVIVNARGEEIARASGETSNPSVVGIETAARVIIETTDNAQSKVPGESRLTGGWVGLAGFGRQSDHQSLRPLLEPSIANVKLTNDVEITLAGLPDSVGVALISGTGSIVAGRNNAGNFVRVGGWGHVFGDEGSGYDIGRNALVAIARHIDGRGPETTLTKLVLDELRITDPYDLITKIYDPSMDKAAIARFASFPLDQAYRKDSVSVAIVSAAAKELANMVTTAARRLGFTGTLPLALTGGIMLHHLVIRDALLSELHREWDAVRAMIVIDPALAAARSLAGYQGDAT